MNNEEQMTAYLLSFLNILVNRSGGEIRIDNLSEYSNTMFQLSAHHDTEDSVILTVEEVFHTQRVQG